jgi:hypothetical protein
MAVPGKAKAVSLTSYKHRVYEHTIWIELTMLVLLLDDGTMWERPSGAYQQWKQLETP